MEGKLVIFDMCLHYDNVRVTQKCLRVYACGYMCAYFFICEIIVCMRMGLEVGIKVDVYWMGTHMGMYMHMNVCM